MPDSGNTPPRAPSPHSSEAITHFVLYGQPSKPPTSRVKPSDWDAEPFVNPTTATWTIPLQPPQLQPLLLGFLPEDMEDKWFVYADGPDAEGRVQVHMHRSWTGEKCMQVEIKGVRDGEDGVTGIGEEGARITGLVYEAGEEEVPVTEEEAKSVVVGVCKWVLGVELLLAEEGARD